MQRITFDEGVEALFEARLRPERDEARQAQSDEELQVARQAVMSVVADCRAGKYGAVARQVLETLYMQARRFIAVQKNSHGLMYKPDPQTRCYQDQEVQQVWGELQLTMARLEGLGVNFAEVPEWEVAAVLMSMV